MDLTLRLLTEDHAAALQSLYDAAPRAFTRWLGHPAPAGQAARDLAQAQAMPGRYQFGALLDGRLIGLLDCKLADDVPGLADIGMLVLADHHADPQLAALVLRIVKRWLASSFDVRRLQTSVPAHEPDELAFWQAQGFALTGEQHRRTYGGYHPRFLVLAQDQIFSMEEEKAITE